MIDFVGKINRIFEHNYNNPVHPADEVDLAHPVKVFFLCELCGLCVENVPNSYFSTTEFDTCLAQWV